jgi:hypothetical protein
MSELEPLPDGFRFTWKQWHVTVALQRFHQGAHGIAAELTASSVCNGQEGILTQGIISLSSFSGRQQLAKRLQQLHDGPNWNTVVEHVCIRGLREYRKGTPSESLEPQEGDETAYFICNPLLYARHPTLLYGPGESGKSIFTLYVACLLQSGGISANLAVVPNGHNVLYLDWELRAPEMRARVKQLRAGHPELTSAPWHRAMSLPLASIALVLRRAAKSNGHLILSPSSVPSPRLTAPAS